MSSESFSGANAIWADVKLPPWWLILIEGILLIIIGFYFFTQPLSTTMSVVFVLGIYWLISGIMGFVRLFWDRSMWGWKIIMGILGIVAGYIVITNPLGSTATVALFTVYMLAFTGIFVGIGDLIHAFRGGGWGAGIMGVISIVIGVWLLFNGLSAMVALPFVLGALAIFSGIVAIINSFRVKGIEDQIQAAGTGM
jgi:uncharacterized membrane protein HdeD (DUF308 family)